MKQRYLKIINKMQWNTDLSVYNECNIIAILIYKNILWLTTAIVDMRANLRQVLLVKEGNWRRVCERYLCNGKTTKKLIIKSMTAILGFPHVKMRHFMGS